MEEGILIRRHPRAPLWKGYVFDAFKGTPEELEFEVRTTGGGSVGRLVFQSFGRKSIAAETPWGRFEVSKGKSIMVDMYEFSRSGMAIASASFNWNRTKLDLSFASGLHVILTGKMTDFGFSGTTDFGGIEVPWQGAFTSDGQSIKDLPHKQVSAEYRQEKPAARGFFDRPKDKDERKATSEDPFYTQWLISLPAALRKNDDLTGVLAIMVCVKWLLVLETPK